MYCLALLVLVLSTRAQADTVVSAQYHYATAAEPAWVTPVVLPAAATAARNQGASIGYLLVEKQVKVEGEGETVFRRIALTPLRQDGLADSAQHEITFNPEYEKLTIHRIVIHRGGRELDKRDGGYVRLLQREPEMDQSLYVGTVSAVIVLDDVRIGDVIEYSYSIQGRNPVFGNRYFSSHTLSWGVPVERVVRRVLVPASRKLQVRIYNGAPQPRIKVRHGEREYWWQLDHVAPFVDEGQSPRWYLPQLWVQLSEYADWRAVQQWANELYVWHGKLAPQLQDMVRQWRGLGDRREAVRRALAFVQRDIRYFGVEMGQNSHRPGDPNTVYARRFGDCKDKAQLLLALLRALDVKAQPALVSAQFNRAIADWLPSPGLFDHVIVLATIDGQRYWLDGTRNFQDGSLETLSTPDYGVALTVGTDSPPLQEMHSDAAQRASVDVEERFVVSAYDRPVEFEVQSVYRGAEAEYQRQRLARDTVEGLSRQYLNYYARRYPGIELEAQPQVRADPAQSELRVVERYRIPDFWDREDGKLYFRLCGGTIQPYTALPDTVRRHSPLALQYPLHVRHSSVLHFPDLDRFDVGNDPVLTVEDNAIRYRQEAAYRKRDLRVVHDYISKTDAVPTARVSRHLDNLRRINGSLCYSGWVAAPGNQVRSTSHKQASNPFSVLEQAVNGVGR